MKKLNVVVLSGGKSAEREISLISGKEVVKNLNKQKYNVFGQEVSKNGIASGSPIPILKKHKVDVVFIAMHGPYGEDGTIQGLLELAGITYTGSRILASALGMDKIYSRKIFIQSGLNTPKYILINKNQKQKSISPLKFPVFVKPQNQGSSIGTSKANDKKQLEKALKVAFKFGKVAIVEEFLDGVEITGAVLGNENPIALPLVEIVPKKEFFDYEAKYDAKITDEIVPARIGKTLTKKAQEAAIKAYKALNCAGFGRVDMIIARGKVYILELNTIPGLTPVSLFPKAAKAAGISYPDLLERIINLALKN